MPTPVTSRHRVGWTAAAAALALSLCAAACSSASSGGNSGAGSGSHKYVIGISNTLVGNGWREEMICSVKAQALASGKVSKVIVVDQNGNAADQITQMRNLISDGVNAIIVDPADPSALNSVIAQAKQKGIAVVAVDQAVTSPDAYDVTNNQEQYGYLGMRWLAQQLHGHGNVALLRGAAGAPADTARQAGIERALKQYPGIKVVKQAYTNWDWSTGSSQMLNILSSGIKVNGVWTSGIDYVAINAFKTAGKPLVPVVGADTNAFVKDILSLHSKGFTGAAVTNPPTVGGVATAVAVKALEGKHPPRVTKLVPQLWDYAHTLSTLKRYYSASVPATYSDQLQIKPWTTYTSHQLLSCQGPAS